jgi:hypothetical protein
VQWSAKTVKAPDKQELILFLILFVIFTPNDNQRLNHHGCHHGLISNRVTGGTQHEDWSILTLCTMLTGQTIPLQAHIAPGYSGSHNFYTIDI